MSELQPTPEQQAVLDAVASTRDNIAVSALAGAAKTSTLVMIAKQERKTAILCLAFNKAIREEMEARMPDNVHCKTLNSFGLAAFKSGLGRFPKTKSNKLYYVLKDVIGDLPKRERDVVQGHFADLLKASKLGKSMGWICGSQHSLCTDGEFFDSLDFELLTVEREVLREVSERSFAQALQGTIDFDDQILLPTLCPQFSFPAYALVMVDEAQDLSPLNHAMLKKACKHRLIAVGDSNQAIYGFRGAHEYSFDELKRQFSMHELTLSVSFRCPQSVVREARWKTPTMQWPEWAQEGTVERLDTWGEAAVPDGSVILCRNNAPLFKLGLQLLKAERLPEVRGNEISDQLLKIMEKFGPAELPTRDVMEKISKWQSTQLARMKSPDTVQDKADCMTIFAQYGETLGESAAYARDLFQSKGRIYLMTGHKAKGLEFDRVFILDEHLIRDHEQDPNIRYVMITRAMKQLTYVYSQDWRD